MSSLTDTIVKIRHYVENNTMTEHENDAEILDIATKHPKLFAMVQKKNCDLGMLYRLITLQEDIYEGKIDNEDGDKQFGEIAAKRYVYPLIDKTE